MKKLLTFCALLCIIVSCNQGEEEVLPEAGLVTEELMNDLLESSTLVDYYANHTFYESILTFATDGLDQEETDQFHETYLLKLGSHPSMHEVDDLIGLEEGTTLKTITNMMNDITQLTSEYSILTKLSSEEFQDLESRLLSDDLFAEKIESRLATLWNGNARVSDSSDDPCGCIPTMVGCMLISSVAAVKAGVDCEKWFVDNPDFAPICVGAGLVVGAGTASVCYGAYVKCKNTESAC
ncbi:MAG: hypothetical protein AAF600_21760 [Bacteroidota bacterium]